MSVHCILLSGQRFRVPEPGNLQNAAETLNCPACFRQVVRILLAGVAGFLVPAAYCASAGASFNANILPILQKHCQSCHRPGEIGPMSLVNYRDVRPWASAIREAVKLRKMPP